MCFFFIDFIINFAYFDLSRSCIFIMYVSLIKVINTAQICFITYIIYGLFSSREFFKANVFSSSHINAIMELAQLASCLVMKNTLVATSVN